MRRLGANSPEPRKRGAWTTRQHTEDRQLYNRTFPTSRSHRGSLSKRRELVLSSLFLGEQNFFSLFSDSFASSELSFASFSACLSISFAPSDESFCAVQLVCRTLGSKRSELLRCSARFLAFRLSFPPSRRAALRMPRLTTRSTSRSSRSSQPPTPNNDKPLSSTEPSPSPSSSRPLHLSGSPRRSGASRASWLRRDQQHQKQSPPPRCYRRTFASLNVRVRQVQHPRRSSPNPHG